MSAQDQQTQITNVARKIIANTTNLQLIESNSRVSPQIEQQVRRIADKLSVVYPVPETVNENLPPPISTVSVFTKLKNTLFWGLGICIILSIVQFILKKYDDKKTGGKSKNITDINYNMRNAPYLLALTLSSQTEAETLARNLITQHLIARADIVPQQHITSPTPDGALLILQTVKGRLKRLQTHVQIHTSTPVPIPILRGHKDHLQWIVNTADGKG
ncbi:MAG: hypothetical protein HOE48_05050 [Candidatus Latescibacteria bacterium]|nr:hypothetical protein [Candidatus Latescibacterota bacterium]MBT4137259.1 hypothetical protein [Candidatus Latescibacterota bacterium]MBT5830088.1 hypothetical protein [Candidatus Latescibacterota bacterium]